MKTYDSITPITAVRQELTFAHKGHPDDTTVISKYQLVLDTPLSEKISFTESVTHDFKSSPLNDGSSFKKIVQSGTIKMTPYRVGKQVTTNNVIRLERMHPFSELWYDCNRSGGHQIKGPTAHRSRWYENYHLERLMSVHNPKSYVNDDLDVANNGYFNNIRNSVMSQTVAEAQASFDALTTAAEGKEAINLIIDAIKAVRHPIKTFLDVRSQLKDPKLYASAWLQFRYGVMPLIYTIQSAVDLYDQRKATYLTARGKDTWQSESNTKPFIFDDRFLYSQFSCNAICRGTSKARYLTAGLQLKDQINVNPFLTGWELVTLSFVIDWFLNVGEVISALTLSLYDLAEQRESCVAIQYELQKDIRYYEKENIFTTDTSFVCQLDSSITHILSPSVLRIPSSDQLIRRITVSGYDRTLFQPGEVKLQLNPQMNLRRWLDATALTLQPALKLLKSLRK